MISIYKSKTIPKVEKIPTLPDDLNKRVENLDQRLLQLEQKREKDVHFLEAQKEAQQKIKTCLQNVEDNQQKLEKHEYEQEEKRQEQQKIITRLQNIENEQHGLEQRVCKQEEVQQELEKRIDEQEEEQQELEKRIQEQSITNELKKINNRHDKKPKKEEKKIPIRVARMLYIRNLLRQQLKK